MDQSQMGRTQRYADDNETFGQRTGPCNGEVAGEEEPQYFLQSQKAKAFMALVDVCSSA